MYKELAFRESGECLPGREKNTYKGPEEGTGLLCLRKSKRSVCLEQRVRITCRREEGHELRSDRQTLIGVVEGILFYLIPLAMSSHSRVLN